MEDQEKITPEEEDVEGQRWRLKRKATDEPTDEGEAEEAEDVEAHSIKKNL